MQPAGAKASGFIGIFLVQVTIIILFGIFVRYDDYMLPTESNSTSEQLSKKIDWVSYPREY